jgi:hypothetical protein
MNTKSNNKIRDRSQFLQQIYFLVSGVLRNSPNTPSYTFNIGMTHWQWTHTELTHSYYLWKLSPNIMIVQPKTTLTFYSLLKGKSLDGTETNNRKTRTSRPLGFLFRSAESLRRTTSCDPTWDGFDWLKNSNHRFTMCQFSNSRQPKTRKMHTLLNICVYKCKLISLFDPENKIMW